MARVGGIILFARNVVDAEQVARLTREARGTQPRLHRSHPPRRHRRRGRAGHAPGPQRRATPRPSRTRTSVRTTTSPSPSWRRGASGACSARPVSAGTSPPWSTSATTRRIPSSSGSARSFGAGPAPGHQSRSRLHSRPARRGRADHPQALPRSRLELRRLPPGLRGRHATPPTVTSRCCRIAPSSARGWPTAS